MTENILAGREAIAKHLGVSWPTCRKYIEKEELPARRMGKSWYSTVEALDKWTLDRLNSKEEGWRKVGTSEAE